MYLSILTNTLTDEYKWPKRLAAQLFNSKRDQSHKQCHLTITIFTSSSSPPCRCHKSGLGRPTFVSCWSREQMPVHNKTQDAVLTRLSKHWTTLPWYMQCGIHEQHRHSRCHCNQLYTVQELQLANQLKNRHVCKLWQVHWQRKAKAC